VRSESLEEEMRAIAKAIIQRAALWEQDQVAYREAYPNATTKNLQ